MTAQGQNLRKEFVNLDLDGLVDEMAHGPMSDRYHAAWAEICRRQAEWQRDSSNALRDSGQYLFLSALAIAITSGLIALFTFLLWYAPHSQ